MLKNVHRPGLATLILALLVLGVMRSETPAQENQKKSQEPTQAVAESPKEGDGRPISDLRQFMRGKLKASNKILEGLTTEDMALIQDGAKALNKMSSSEKWRVNNDAMYKQFSAEFRRLTNDLNSAAEAENLDQAALKWMGVTMACIECHRYVRNTLVVDQGAFK
ncbi:hypothetical protein [Thalassoglobus polymorphus]|uniref:Cytochrome C n=1 Tax=Thalassoglobus polymorphus TaxID=2527994 RepID=A0A517QJL9_9PLAN|nr:hypothetical protein [Thalassoglobus polymorphus]QDT31840.1 hypothetical protein Mal48_10760 [Thalassoglobus polymorphus]